MKKFPVILDIETQHTFREFPDPKDLKISVAVIYDYRDSMIKAFKEKEISAIFPILESASYIVGYNNNSFDIPVLAPYYLGNINHFKTFDILDDIKNIIGRRLALNDVVFATLGKKKSGHGLHAIELFREGKFDDLIKYCTDDVMLTKELFDYGIKTKEIFYLNEVGKVKINVDWQKYIDDNQSSDMPLTLPF